MPTRVPRPALLHQPVQRELQLRHPRFVRRGVDGVRLRQCRLRIRNREQRHDRRRRQGVPDPLADQHRAAASHHAPHRQGRSGRRPVGQPQRDDSRPALGGDRFRVVSRLACRQLDAALRQ